MLQETQQGGEGRARQERLPERAGASRWGDYGLAPATVALATLVALALAPILNLVDLTMLYLMGVLLVGIRKGRGPAMLGACLSVPVIDFVFVPPRFVLAFNDLSYLFTFTVASLSLIAILTTSARRQAHIARQGAFRIMAQNRLSHKLAAARGTDPLLRAAAAEIGELTGSSVTILMRRADGQIQPRAQHGTSSSLNAKEMEIAGKACAAGEPMGRGTQHFPSAKGLYLPLRGEGEAAGAVGVFFAASPQGETIQLIQTLAGQLALALEIERLEQEKRKIQMQMETERMRNSILSSVSHDLRTPLATIMGSAGSLLESSAALDEETRRSLAQDIHDQADRLNRLIANLLEMTRLEGGALELRREVQTLEEIVGTAFHVLGKTLEGRRVAVDLPADLPPVNVDGLLIQHVFMNLLENAVNYVPAGEPVEIAAFAAGDEVTVEVADRGPGLAPGEEEKIFEKFQRGSAAARKPGAGLGLAICRGIVEAHGGKIEVRRREGGGLAFRFTLPAQSSIMRWGGDEPDMISHPFEKDSSR